VNTRARNAATAAALKETEACNRQIGMFMTALDDLESKISLGLTFSVYSTGVNRIRLAYGALTPSALSGACQAAVAAGNTSLNTYITALRQWTVCTNNTKCSTASIATDLQTQWANAEAQTEAAKTALDEVGDDVLVPSYANVVPTSESKVAGTVYGGAVTLICKAQHVPATAKAPCAQLETILGGGVGSKELADLDKSVSDLDIALQLKPAKS
jgi:hypothetical protein